MLNVYLGYLFLVGGINVYFEDLFLELAVFSAYFSEVGCTYGYYAVRFEHSLL